MNKWIAIFAAAGLVVVGAVAVPAISAGNSSQISGCVSTKTGVLRISSKCLPGERRLTWNRQGVDGAQGLPGLQGFPGASGATGQAAINFASNCYQWLKQAESIGYSWGIAADRTRFETLTGCTIRNIDLNPNAQIPGFYPNFGPHVLTSKWVATYGYGGEGSPSGGAYFSLGGTAIHEITVTKPEGTELCSSSEENKRVFVQPETGKTFVRGPFSGSHQGFTADIYVGWGQEATETIRSWSQSVNGLESYVIGNNSFQLHFEPFPTSMPLDETVEIRLQKVYVGSNRIPRGDYYLYAEGGLLTKVTQLDDQIGAEAVFSIRSNALERGISNISFELTGIDIANGTTFENEKLTHRLSVGVIDCNWNAFEMPADNSFPPYSNLYRIRETAQAPDYELGESFLNGIGWATRAWFVAEPNYLPQ